MGPTPTNVKPYHTHTPVGRAVRQEISCPCAQAEGGRLTVGPAHVQGLVHGLVAALEQQPLLRVHLACLCRGLRDGEEAVVEQLGLM